jgi:hypothetical protein
MLGSSGLLIEKSSSWRRWQWTGLKYGTDDIIDLDYSASKGSLTFRKNGEPLR